MVADPIPSQAILCGSENVKAGFEPIRKTVSDFDRFVQLMICGIHAVDRGLETLKSEIAVQFDHGVAGIDKVRTIYLDFVIVLRVQRSGAQRDNGEEGKKR